MKRLLSLIALSTLCWSNILYAQDPVQPDTLLTNINLDEIVIEASPMIRKSDRDLYMPSSQARELSKNGINLLQNMQIPTLSINSVMETISNPRGEVQVRINGRAASVKEVKSLLSESIVRVEYHENPSLRYGNVNAVLDIIVRNPTVGGSFTTDNMFWLSDKVSSDMNANLKLNRGKGQFGMRVEGRTRNHAEVFREYHENIKFADGSTLIRTETPREGSQYNEKRIWPVLEYSYTDPEKTTFYANLHFTHTKPQSMLFEGLMSSSGTTTRESTDPVFLTVEEISPSTAASTNVYFDRKLGKGQSLVVDFLALINNNRSGSSYVERLSEGGTPTVDIHTLIKDRNWSFALETDYIKEWEKAKLSTGVRWNAYRNRSTYLSAGDALFHQRRDKFYAFAEYTQRMGEVTLTAGIAAGADGFHLREENKGKTNWDIIPRLNIVWRKDWSTLRLNASGGTIAPSLSETNPTMQQIDRFQYQVGNPDLKGYSYGEVSLNWAQSFRRMNTALEVGYWSTSSHAFAPLYRWNDSDQLISTWTNGHQKRVWWAQASGSLDIVPKWFSLNGYVHMSRYFTRGENYRHQQTSWSGNVNAILTHWGFQLMFTCQLQDKDLTGERTSRGENINMVMLSYTWKNWRLGAGVMMPFGKYSQENGQLNEHYSYHQTLRSNFVERMPILTVIYNVNWGKQKHGANKLSNLSADTMSSKAASR